MAINVSQAFKRTSIAPIDETLALTKAQMVATVDTLMPAYYFTICQDDGKIYLYDKSATPSVTTGKFKEFSGGGGGGSSDVKFFTTTDTLSKTINGTKVVAAADLPGVTWSDLKVGSSVIKDAKGTMGLVTTITGTTSVTVTTATTSTPTVELTQAQYDALATKDPDTVYFITDSQPNAGTYMGAYETIYSTTERVIGSYKGKPLYQVTLPQVSMPSAVADGSRITTDIDISAYNVEHVIDIEGWHTDGSLAGVVNIAPGTNTTVFAWHYKTDEVIRLVNSYSGYNGRPTVITIRYTKTTDTVSPVEYAHPNDYSTTEKIVGTWIDGKPIYQKTFGPFWTSSYYTAGRNWVSLIDVASCNIETYIGSSGTVTVGPSKGLVRELPYVDRGIFEVSVVYDYQAGQKYLKALVTNDASNPAYFWDLTVTIRYTKTS